jgi:cell division protein FtsQ
MSREGKFRFVMATLRVGAAMTIVAVCGWGAWLVAASIRENTHAMPAAAKAAPMKAPELRTDGVLDSAWLARTLDIPAKSSLLELDLDKLRTRLLGEPQVANATLTKNFPDRLIVTIAERSPVARVMTQMLGEQRAFLVARDGVIYAGEGYDRATSDSLPWLDGVKIQPAGGGFRPIPGMEVAAELLSKARLEAEHLYATWAIVSLARLESDRKIEVRMKDGRHVIYFSTNDDFFRQLAKLDYIVDTLSARAADTEAKIDLSLGQDVPVMVTPVVEAAPENEKVGRGLRSAPDSANSRSVFGARRGTDSAPYRPTGASGHSTGSGQGASRFQLLPASVSAATSTPHQTFFVLPQSSNSKREL